MNWLFFILENLDPSWHYHISDTAGIITFVVAIIQNSIWLTYHPVRIANFSPEENCCLNDSLNDWICYDLKRRQLYGWVIQFE
jgi:hypothetical protein